MGRYKKGKAREGFTLVSSNSYLTGLWNDELQISDKVVISLWGLWDFIKFGMLVTAFVIAIIAYVDISNHSDDDHHDALHKIEDENDLNDLIYEDDVEGGYLDDDNHLWGLNGGLYIPFNLTVRGTTNLRNDLIIENGDIIQTGGDIITDGTVTGTNIVQIMNMVVATSESATSKRALPIDVVEAGKAVGCANKHCHIKQGFSTFDATMINDTFIRSKTAMDAIQEDWYATFHFQQVIDDDDNAQLVMNLVQLQEDNTLTVNQQIQVESTDFDLTYNYDVRVKTLPVENHLVLFYNSPTTLQSSSTEGNVWARVIRVVDASTNSVLIGNPFVINLESNSTYLAADVEILSWLSTSVDVMFVFSEGGDVDDGLSVRGCTVDTNTLSMVCTANEPSTLNTSHNNVEDITELMRQPGTESTLLPCGILLFGGCQRDEDYFSSCTDTQLNLAYISRSGNVVNIQYDGMDMPSLYNKVPITWTYTATMLNSIHILVTVEDLLGFNHGFAFVIEMANENVCAFASVNNVTLSVARIGPLKPLEIYTIQDSGNIFQELAMPISSLTTLDDTTAVIAFREDFKQSHSLNARLVHVDPTTLEITYGQDQVIAPFLSRDIELRTVSDDSFVVIYNDYSPSSLALDDYSLLEISHCTRTGKDTISCAQQTPEDQLCIALENGVSGDTIQCLGMGINCDLVDFGDNFRPGPFYAHCDGSLSLSDHHLAGQGTDCVPQLMGMAVTKHCIWVTPLSINTYGNGLNV